MTRTQPSWLPQGHRGLDFDGFGGDDVEDGAVGGDDVHVCADVRDGTAACRKGLDCRDSSRGLIRLGGTAGGDGGVLAGELYAVGLAHRSRDNIDEKRCEAETQASIARDWWDKVDPSSPREQLNFHPDSSVGILEPACCYSAQQRGIKLVREFPTFESPVVFPWTASQRNSRARTVCAGGETPNQRRINPRCGMGWEKKDIWLDFLFLSRFSSKCIPLIARNPMASSVDLVYPTLLRPPIAPSRCRRFSSAVLGLVQSPLQSRVERSRTRTVLIIKSLPYFATFCRDSAVPFCHSAWQLNLKSILPPALNLPLSVASATARPGADAFGRYSSFIYEKVGVDSSEMGSWEMEAFTS
ncbi:hypothetical protein C8R44DRAFT_858754 [Mycena epipterygia]|nr:hypothetical protein C8R44DRAFT_858754 [Mycena epipterygia]